jgi:hypothetical protein
MKYLFVAALQIAVFTGCKSGVSDAVITYGSDRQLQDAALVLVATPLYLAGVRAPQGPAILKTGTPEEIRNSAITTARADIAAGKPRVAYTGGIASQAVGVPIENLTLVKKLPKVPLPSGCIDNLEEATIYAEAYNKEVLPYLISRNEVHK